MKTNPAREMRLWLTTIVAIALVITNEKFQDRCEATYIRVKGMVDKKKKDYTRKKNK